MKNLYIFHGDPSSDIFEKRVGHWFTTRFTGWSNVLPFLIEKRLTKESPEELVKKPFASLIFKLRNYEVCSDINVLREIVSDLPDGKVVPFEFVEAVAKEIFKSMEDESVPFLFIKGSKKNAKILWYLGVSL